MVNSSLFLSHGVVMVHIKTNQAAAAAAILLLQLTYIISSWRMLNWIDFNTNAKATAEPPQIITTPPCLSTRILLSGHEKHNLNGTTNSPSSLHRIVKKCDYSPKLTLNRYIKTKYRQSGNITSSPNPY